MLLLKDIDISYLDDSIIIGIARNLGCDIGYPPPDIKNKYLKEVYNRMDNKEKIGELKDKFFEEQKRIDKEYDKIFTDYINKIIKWLDDNGYIKDR